MKLNKKGSVLPTVILATFVVIVIALSLLDHLNVQRRLNLKKELLLQANEAAESSVDYAYSYIVNDINSRTLGQATTVPTSGYRTFSFAASDQSFLQGQVVMPSSYTGRVSNVSFTAPDVRVGAPSDRKRFYIDGSDQANALDPNKDQWVQQQIVPIISTITASQGGLQYTAHIQKNISSREIALFQYAIFYQGQLHLHRGYGLMGGVHANGNLFLNAHNGDGAIYNGSVTSGHHIYRGSTFDSGGTGSDPFGYVAITSEADGGYADTTTSPAFAPAVTGLNGSLKIYVDTTSQDNFANLDNLDCRVDNWKKVAQDLFNFHLEDISMNSPTLAPVGTAGYAMDVKSTSAVNEFNNAPYGLLEPTLPIANAYHQKSLANNLEAKSSLVLMVEYNSDDIITLHKIDPAAVPATTDFNKPTGPGGSVPFDLNPATNPNADLRQYSDPWRMFVIKAYKVSPTWDPSLGTDIHGYLTPVTLPTNKYHVIGKASSDVTMIAAGGDLTFEEFDVAINSLTHNILSSTATPVAQMSAADKNTLNTVAGVSVTVNKGLFDSRLGRGVAPLTIDIDALKKVMEAPFSTIVPANATNTDYLFRTEFDPTAMLAATPVAKRQWNGLVYIEFPTSLVIGDTTPNATAPAGVLNRFNGKITRRFATASAPELRHPDRWDTTDNYNRANRTDGIVPFAPELRRYPAASTANLNSTILDAQYVIPAVQIINGGVLPHPNPDPAPVSPSVLPSSKEGFTIATNAPLYLVGNYNCDGDYTTGTNFAATSPTAYATADNPSEIPAALFCDTFTVLSNGWGERGGRPHSNRENSFYGKNNASTAGDGSAVGSIGSPPGRPSRARSSVTNPNYNGGYYNGFVYPATAEYVEISACIAHGEYPIFEFFNHALENYNALYSVRSATKPNPIIIKGSLVAMFHSEIQHIKQAYGRNVNNDIQTFYQDHGAFAISAVRYHDFLVNGFFPPGTPMLYVTQPKDFRLLRWGDPEDKAVLTTAGLTP